MALPNSVDLKPGTPTEGLFDGWGEWFNGGPGDTTDPTDPPPVATTDPRPVATRNAPRQRECEKEPHAAWFSTTDNRAQLCEKSNELVGQQKALEEEAKALKRDQKFVEAQEKLVKAAKLEVQFYDYVSTDENTREISSQRYANKQLEEATAKLVELKKNFVRNVEAEEDGRDSEYQRLLRDYNMSEEEAKKVVPNADGNFLNNFQASKYKDIDEAYQAAKERRKFLNAQAAAQTTAATPPKAAAAPVTASAPKAAAARAAALALERVAARPVVPAPKPAAPKPAAPKAAAPKAAAPKLAVPARAAARLAAPAPARVAAPKLAAPKAEAPKAKSQDSTKQRASLKR